MKKCLILFLCTSGLGFFTTPIFSQDEETENKVYNLNPFTVDESQDSGYIATSTLAGTRLNTNLKDVASSVSVIQRLSLKTWSSVY